MQHFFVISPEKSRQSGPFVTSIEGMVMWRYIGSVCTVGQSSCLDVNATEQDYQGVYVGNLTGSACTVH